MTPFLTTLRLIMVPVTVEHCSPEYLSWLNNQEVTRYLETGAFPTTLDSLKNYVQQKSNNEFFLAIHRKDDNKHIGNIRIHAINFIHGIAEYGILIGDKDSWGKGFAKEATERLLQHCFDRLNLRKIALGVVEDNLPAVELYKKMQFIVEGRLINHGYYNGKYCNVLRMARFNESAG
jgi:[ribosomal protein S5]-alanine N-acetyltransferase